MQESSDELESSVSQVPCCCDEGAEESWIDNKVVRIARKCVCLGVATSLGITGLSLAATFGWPLMLFGVIFLLSALGWINLADE